MNIPKELSTLPGSDAFHIVDSTKLKCFLTCPRKYLYEYVLHWRQSSPNIHLEFGTAWHLAKEHLFVHGYDDEQISEAYAIFLAHFRKYFSASDDLNLGAKNAGNALVALTEYAKAFRHINSRMRILATEVSGRVPIDDEFMISVKMDAIVEDDSGIWDLDHKTTSRDSPTDDQAYFLSLQMNAYTHALYCMYPQEKVRGALVDISVFRKTGNLHKRMPILKKFSHLEEWYSHTRRWFQSLRDEYLRLAHDPHSDSGHLAAFPKNTESCTKYGLCPYFSLCQSPSNPILDPEAIPQGFSRVVWNPHFSDKSWKPKLILEPDGTTHPPTPTDLRAYSAAEEHLLESSKRSELDGFHFTGFTS